MKKILIAAAILAMAGAARAAELKELETTAATLRARFETEGAAVPAVKGYLSAYPAASAPVEWVALRGGSFRMGTDDGDKTFRDAKPVHAATVAPFEMSKTPVTVEQYAVCVKSGNCTEPVSSRKGLYCNWGNPDRLKHPVNCVSWDQANQFAVFAGARLPSETEWEYAATGEGKNQKYPWGNEEVTEERVALADYIGGMADFRRSTLPVCSKPAGNTAQGLCDMTGSVWQWTRDTYQDSYNGVPADGSAFEGAGTRRVLRGGSFRHINLLLLRSDARNASEPGTRYGAFGFRLAK